MAGYHKSHVGVQDGKTAVERAVKRKLNALHDLCGSLACTRGLGPKKLNFSDVFVPKSKPMQRSYVAEARQQSRVECLPRYSRSSSQRLTKKEAALSMNSLGQRGSRRLLLLEW